MPQLSAYTDDLRRYSRIWSRTNPAMLWWHAGLEAWQTMLAAPHAVARGVTRRPADSLASLRDPGAIPEVTPERVVALYQAWMGATRELVLYQQRLAIVSAQRWWTAVAPFSPLLTGLPAAAVPAPRKPPEPVRADTGTRTDAAAASRMLTAEQLEAPSAAKTARAKPRSTPKRTRRPA
jgi:hypothetical protein